jgi:polyphenol oxidase
MMIDRLQSPLLGVPHGFLGRRGGISTGTVAGLNTGLGTGDAAAAVTENRRRALAAVSPDARLVSVYQYHSALCVIAGDWRDEDRPRADALVTDRPGLALGIVTADCAPVLFADREAGVIGAAHAGWKGALAGVTDATIAAMETLGADRDRISAAVGPCIARASYEVDEAFLNRFTAISPANERFFSAGTRPQHHQFDLEGYVVDRLAQAGIRRVAAMGVDTYADDTRYFSFRRATHTGAPDYGRQLSLIALA